MPTARPRLTVPLALPNTIAAQVWVRWRTPLLWEAQHSLFLSLCLFHSLLVILSSRALILLMFHLCLWVSWEQRSTQVCMGLDQHPLDSELPFSLPTISHRWLLMLVSLEWCLRQVGYMALDQP